MLYTPSNFQLVGAVFVETKRTSGSEQETDLVPSMDREGLLKTAASEQLREYVRAGIEFLAHADKAELDRQAGIRAKQLARDARSDIKKTIEFIQSSTDLNPRDKSRLPGVVVNAPAAASYLDISLDSFMTPAVQTLFEIAKYAGPFAGAIKPRWWRGLIDDIVASGQVSGPREFIAGKTGCS